MAIPGTAGAQSPNNATVNPDGSLLVDSVDGIYVFAPALNLSNGTLASANVSGIPLSSSFPGTAQGIPQQLAILVELRVMNTLLHSQLGDTRLDLEQMRADELYNVVPATGNI